MRLLAYSQQHSFLCVCGLAAYMPARIWKHLFYFTALFCAYTNFGFVFFVKNKTACSIFIRGALHSDYTNHRSTPNFMIQCRAKWNFEIWVRPPNLWSSVVRSEIWKMLKSCLWFGVVRKCRAKVSCESVVRKCRAKVPCEKKNLSFWNLLQQNHFWCSTQVEKVQG